MTRFAITRAVLLLVATVGGLTACGGGSEEAATASVTRTTPYCWTLPAHFPPPKDYLDNEITAEKVALGRYLFYDKRLSFNQTRACASCHQSAKGFADGLPLSTGATDEVLPRHSMALVNGVYNAVFDWANPTLLTAHAQVLVPMFNEFPIEMGWTGYETAILDRLQNTPLYAPLFAAAYPNEPNPYQIASVSNALAAFVSSLVSAQSPYDRATAAATVRHGGGGRGGEDREPPPPPPPIIVNDGVCVTPTSPAPATVSAAVLRGEDLFFSEQLECFHCHGGFNFSQSVRHENTVIDDMEFHNNGLYNVGGTGDYPPNQEGLWEFTQRPQDMGRFRAPTLRNVAMTAPYMHDGSLATLSEVIDHYARGGRLIAEGPWAGDGALSPFRSELIQGFTLTDGEKADLIAFLESLTDWDFLCNPAHQDPFGVFPPHPTCSAP